MLLNTKNEDRGLALNCMLCLFVKRMKKNIWSGWDGMAYVGRKIN